VCQTGLKYHKYKKVNEWRGKVLISKQSKKDFQFKFRLLEIAGPKVVKQHAFLKSEHHTELYVNSDCTLLFRKEAVFSKRSSFEICSFNKETGEIRSQVKRF